MKALTMRRLLPGFALLPLLFTAAPAAERLTDRQMDTVTAGFSAAIAFADAAAFGRSAFTYTDADTLLIAFPKFTLSFSSSSSVSIAH